MQRTAQRVQRTEIEFFADFAPFFASLRLMNGQRRRGRMEIRASAEEFTAGVEGLVA
jgi:hypothetical protein